MNKKTVKNIDHHKKPAAQNIRNPFLRLMKWIGSVHTNNTVCKD
jgi:hypothetical protein